MTNSNEFKIEEMKTRFASISYKCIQILSPVSTSFFVFPSLVFGSVGAIKTDSSGIPSDGRHGGWNLITSFSPGWCLRRAKADVYTYSPSATTPFPVFFPHHCLTFDANLVCHSSWFSLGRRRSVKAARLLFFRMYNFVQFPASLHPHFFPSISSPFFIFEGHID